MSMVWWRKQKAKDSSTPCIGAFSDVGKVRGENEDAYGHFPEDAEGDQLFIVADGMGGHSRGREASTTTVQQVRETYFSAAKNDAAGRLEEAFKEANREVYAMASEVDGPGSMGTTGTALALVGGEAFVAHVGDSRAYHFTANETRKVTQDHTMVESMVREGLLTENEAQTHPRRGTLTRAIGVRPELTVDVVKLGPPHAEDRFLLCTDGLSDIPVSELRDVVLGATPQEACEALVERANEQGGYDNATALVVCVE